MQYNYRMNERRNTDKQSWNDAEHRSRSRVRKVPPSPPYSFKREQRYPSASLYRFSATRIQFCRKSDAEISEKNPRCAHRLRNKQAPGAPLWTPRSQKIQHLLPCRFGLRTLSRFCLRIFYVIIIIIIIIITEQFLVRLLQKVHKWITVCVSSVNNSYCPWNNND